MNDFEYYNKHYITIRPDNVITDAWSDGPHPEKDTAIAVCINNKGGYQFRFYPDGEENPSLYDMNGIPLYKWDSTNVIPRTKEEIEAEKALIPPPHPSAQEQLRADVDFIAIMTGIDL